MYLYDDMDDEAATQRKAERLAERQGKRLADLSSDEQMALYERAARETGYHKLADPSEMDAPSADDMGAKLIAEAKRVAAHMGKKLEDMTYGEMVDTYIQAARNLGSPDHPDAYYE